MIGQSGKFFLIVLFLPVIVFGNVCPSSYEKESKSHSERVNLLVVKNGVLLKAEGPNVVSESIDKLESKFNVRIRKDSVAGFILDLDQAEREVDYKGFNLDAWQAEPLLCSWFHNPFPDNPATVKYTQDAWEYALKKNFADESPEHLIGYAAAIGQIDHVFFPLKKFKTGFYFDPSSNQETNEGLESVLHEALHIWHMRNNGSVTKLLSTPGSYYERARATLAIHPEYLKEMNDYDKSPIQGFPSHSEFSLDILKRVKWPQRYGALTARKKLIAKDKYTMDRPTEKTFEGIALYSQEGPAGDLHALDNEFEYFAILMQLYVFSPKDFQKVATVEEAKFARWLFKTYFN